MIYPGHKHERNQKNLLKKNPSSARQPWRDVATEVEDRLKALHAECPEDAQYCLGISIGFRECVRMIPLLIPVMFSDATHNKGALAGTTTYCSTALDANHHIVPITVTYCVGAENRLGWFIHMDFVKKHFGDLLQDWVIIIDGIQAGVDVCEQLGFSTFQCSRHLVKHMNAKQTQLYRAALHARNIDKLTQIKDQDPDHFQSLEHKHMKRQLYMLMSGRTCGHHCQSPVESLNAMLDEARKAQHVPGE